MASLSNLLALPLASSPSRPKIVPKIMPHEFMMRLEINVDSSLDTAMTNVYVAWEQSKQQANSGSADLVN